MKTILIVDDKLNTLRLLTDYLEAHGFRTVTASNGREALMVARQEQPDLILLDIMMPQMDGLEFMRYFRKAQQTPVIMLTARVEETDKVVGLELGADDYVTKPFGMAELVARIRAVLRRAGEPATPAAVVRVGGVTLDRGAHRVWVDDRLVELTPSEFNLLAVLMTAPGQVFTRAQLLERAKGDLAETVERTMDVHIRNLRAKLEADPARPHYIRTVFGVGYRFYDGD